METRDIGGRKKIPYRGVERRGLVHALARFIVYDNSLLYSKIKYSAAVIKRFILSLLAIGLLTSAAKGDMILTLSDDGFNLTMTLTGDYDFSDLTPASESGLGFPALIVPSAGIFGWETGDAPGYTVTYSGSLSGTGVAFDPTSSSVTTPMWFYTSQSTIYLSSAFPTVGTVNNTAVFSGVTLASLGMIAGQTMTATWQGGSATISTIQAVPEPSTWALVAVGSVVAFWRLRRWSA